MRSLKFAAPLHLPRAQAADAQGTKMAVLAICRACVAAGAWPALNDNILLLSKRRSQLKQAITAMVQECMSVLDKTPSVEAKLELIKALTDAFTYCDSAYAALTDASGAEIIEITQESGRQSRTPRAGLLTLNYAHNNEIYGSMVIFLRMKGITPPASEPRPPAAGKK